MVLPRLSCIFRPQELIARPVHHWLHGRPHGHVINLVRDSTAISLSVGGVVGMDSLSLEFPFITPPWSIAPLYSIVHLVPISEILTGLSLISQLTMASTDERPPIPSISPVTFKGEIDKKQKARMATIADDDERLLAQIGYTQVCSPERWD